MYNSNFNGIEIDMLSLGDADSILVTAWAGATPWRVLIDGGRASDAKIVGDFLQSRYATSLYAVVCTHMHNDHARGLIELVKDRSLTITTGWMHDMRNHASADALSRASSGNSSQADGVKEALETTKELASAFASRYITPSEPFAGATISFLPGLSVLGPNQEFYKLALEESMGEPVPAYGSLLSALAGISITESYPPAIPPLAGRYGLTPPPAAVVPFPPSLFSAIGSPLASPPKTSPDLSAALLGVLRNSSVEESPKTQPFNNTSVILGMEYGGSKFLFTADAGAEALDVVPPLWKNLFWMQVPHHGSDGNLSQANIERFCPKIAYVSACGDTSHPSRAIVNGLIKVGAEVFSTHTANPGHLRYHMGSIPWPCPPGYGRAIPLKGNAAPLPFAEWFSAVPGRL